MPIKIKDDALIIEDLNVYERVLIVSLAIVIGSYMFLSTFNNSLSGWEYLITLFELFFWGLIILAGLYILSVHHSVTIDKKSQNVVIREYSIIRGSKSIKEIPFSNILLIQIKRTRSLEPDLSDDWSIDLMTMQGRSIEIYYASNESDAEKVAEKISKVTNSEITRITRR